MKRKRNNPARSASQYGAAEAVVSGRSAIMPVKVARELIAATPKHQREKFARELASRRRRNWEFGSKPFKGSAARYDWAIKDRGLGGAVIGVVHASTRKEALAEFRRGRAPYGDTSRLKLTAVKQNPTGRRGGRRRRRNQEEDTELKAARAMYKKFTGRPASKVEIVEQLRVLPGALADCGRMVELDVHRPGVRDVLHFPESSHVRVGTTGNGGQLYFVKGDQAVDLKGIPHAGKDHVDLGVCHRIVYFTSKDFHNFEPSEYSHKFGEEDGIRPTLHYDVRSKRLYLTGGNYEVRREGIVN